MSIHPLITPDKYRSCQEDIKGRRVDFSFSYSNFSDYFFFL